jgi:glucose-6-phosphate 1-epimerase
MSDPHPFDIPGLLTISEGNGGLRKMTVTTDHSTAEIYLHGAHVTHFQKHGDAPLLFMSSAGLFHPDKPIRGGIPVIFPWFGPREGLPAHGFARNVDWEPVGHAVLADGSVRIEFRMPAIEFYEVSYLVTVGEGLALELVVTNTGDRDESFETCLHTYFQIGSVDAVSISGLKDCGYYDKVRETGALETAPAIRITGEVDRAYFDTTAPVEIHDAALGRTIRVEKSGSHSTVVWNPWIEKSKRMADFGDDEYHRMVCVESGNVGKNKVLLPPGECATLKVTLTTTNVA